MVAHSDLAFVIDAQGRERDALIDDPGPTQVFASSFSSLLLGRIDQSSIREVACPRRRRTAPAVRCAARGARRPRGVLGVLAAAGAAGGGATVAARSGERRPTQADSWVSSRWASSATRATRSGSCFTPSPARRTGRSSRRRESADNGGMVAPARRDGLGRWSASSRAQLLRFSPALGQHDSGPYWSPGLPPGGLTVGPTRWPSTAGARRALAVVGRTVLRRGPAPQSMGRDWSPSPAAPGCARCGVHARRRRGGARPAAHRWSPRLRAWRTGAASSARPTGRGSQTGAAPGRVGSAREHDGVCGCETSGAADDAWSRPSPAAGTCALVVGARRSGPSGPGRGPLRRSALVQSVGASAVGPDGRVAVLARQRSARSAVDGGDPAAAGRRCRAPPSGSRAPGARPAHAAFGARRSTPSRVNGTELGVYALDSGGHEWAECSRQVPLAYGSSS